MPTASPKVATTMQQPNSTGILSGANLLFFQKKTKYLGQKVKEIAFLDMRRVFLFVRESKTVGFTLRRAHSFALYENEKIVSSYVF